MALKTKYLPTFSLNIKLIPICIQCKDTNPLFNNGLRAFLFDLCCLSVDNIISYYTDKAILLLSV